jgi:hypothetical protein
MSKLPPLAPKLMVRGVEVNAVPVICRVPPSNVSAPEAAPRLALDETDRVPADMVVPPP